MRYVLVLIVVLIVLVGCGPKSPRYIIQTTSWELGVHKRVCTRGYAYNTNTHKNTLIYDTSWSIPISNSNWISIVHQVLEDEYSNAAARIYNHKGPEDEHHN